MPPLLPILLAGIALAEEAPDPDAPMEVIVVRDVAELREQLDVELELMGYVHAQRRGDRVVYKNRQRWKPTVVVHDSGWLQLKDGPLILDGLSFAGPMVFFRGRTQSKRQREHTRFAVLEATAPTVRAWADAIAGAAVYEEGYEAPAIAADRIRFDDVAEGAMALATGTHPQDWSPDQRRILASDLDRAQLDYLEREVIERYAPDPRVVQALREVPRMRFADEQVLEHVGRSLPFGGESGWAAKGPTQGRPLSAPHGAWVASEAQVAWACKAARITPTSRVLELGREAGYRAAVLAQLGAEVHRVDASEARIGRLGRLVASLGLGVATRLADPSQGWAEAGPFDAILLEADTGGLPAALADQLADRGVLLLLDQGRTERLTRRGDELRQDQLLEVVAPDLRRGSRRQDGRVETPGP